MSINWRADNENMIHIHDGILFSYKEKWSLEIHGWNWKLNYIEGDNLGSEKEFLPGTISSISILGLRSLALGWTYYCCLAQLSWRQAIFQIFTLLTIIKCYPAFIRKASLCNHSSSGGDTWLCKGRRMCAVLNSALTPCSLRLKNHHRRGGERM